MSSPVAHESLQGLVARISRPYVRGKRNLGLCIGVYQQGRGAILSYGRGAGTGRPRGDSIFEIGSVTKVFTALLLAEMAQGGEVGLDDRIESHLPTVAGTPAGALTLRQLATHTAGLPEWPLTRLQLMWRARHKIEKLTPEDLGVRLARGRVHPASAKSRYSSFGMGLLGHLLAQSLGRSYDDAVRARICRPLGMNDTGIALTVEQRRRLIPGHEAGGKLAPAISIRAMQGAGALRSTTADMLRFVAANLNPDDTPLGRAIAACQEPQVTAGPVQMGLGWIISPLPETDVHAHWHNGATWGYTSYVGFVKALGLGVVVLSNYRLTLPEVLLGCSADALGVRLLSALVKERDQAVGTAPL